MHPSNVGARNQFLVAFSRSTSPIVRALVEAASVWLATITARGNETAE